MTWERKKPLQRGKPLNPGRGLQPGKPLERRTPLQGGGGLRGVPLQRSSPTPRTPTSPRRRPTVGDPDAAGAPIPQELRTMALARAMYACDWCGEPLRDWPGYSCQHRRPRRAGGRVGAHTAANLVILCGSATTGCHFLMESRRVFAVSVGFLIPDGAAVPPPEATPIWRHQREWVIPGDGVWLPSEPLAA